MRTHRFRNETHNRFWWHKLADTDYEPPVFAALSDEEWALMEAWYEDSGERFAQPGEISIPGITLLTALIAGNGLRAVVQCGHYVGYSTLLLGFALRRMGRRRALFSVDIDPVATAYTQGWLDRCGLTEVVHLHLASSSDPEVPVRAAEYHGMPPQLVFVDSSHQYAHTLEELDLWYGHLRPGGMLALHDTSIFATSFDPTRRGGVLGALRDWGPGRNMVLLNADVDGSLPPDQLAYKDGCGFGLIQKPLPG